MGRLFSKPVPQHHPLPLMETATCEINWGENNEIKTNLREITPRHSGVTHLRILVIGPVGAGKSSFIHSIRSIFQNRIVNATCEVAANAETSHTITYTLNHIEDGSGNDLPFVIGDVMGLEGGEHSGVHPKDIAKVLKGHIKDDYTFNPVRPCPRDDRKYNLNPSLNDQIHCLVFVIPIDNFQANSCSSDEEKNILMNINIYRKMRNIRDKACNLKIPQVVILTKVDLACPHVKSDIKHIYRSQTLHRKVQACSNALGIPTNGIFPVKNYHEEKQLSPAVDAVLLFTLSHILNAANDFLKEKMKGEAARNTDVSGMNSVLH